MQAQRAFLVALAWLANALTVQAAVRQVYVAANEVIWDYAPSGNLVNKCAGGPYVEGSTALYVAQGLGSRYWKALYQEYQDGSFQALKTRDQDEVHLGLVGPVIYATPDDEVQVVLRNNLDFAINIVPSGAVTNDTSALAPNETRAYTWTVPAEAAPDSKAFHSSRPFLYRSTVDQVGHANAGLIGVMVVTRAADARPRGQPADVDRELFALFQVMNENDSPLLNKTRAMAGWTNATGPLSSDDFEESNKKHEMNGFLFCNTPGLVAPFGRKVRWYVFVEGNEVDLHNAHWHGNVLLRDGHHVDQHSLLPGEAQVLDMVPDNPGNWLFHCHVNDHILAGMMSIYTVENANGTEASLAPALPTQGPGAGAVREYFIAALEDVWDYAPSGTENCGAKPAALGETAKGFLTASSSGLGRRHIKAQYVEFIDATFTVRKPRAPEDAYLGLLGPIIRATVGDTIRLTFKNGVPHNTTVHPHGVLYPKDAEGAIYDDGTSGRDKMDDIIPPGSNWTFVWQVTERAGPGPSDPSSLLWMYHSHFDEVADVNAGLMGAIIISRKGSALPSGAPNDVDREFVLSYSIEDEVRSFYFAQNLAQLGASLTNDQQSTLSADNDGAGNEHFHAINGMLYCNLPHMNATQGERVRLHIMSLGTEDGIHAPAITASTLDWEGARREASQLIPGSMRSMDVELTAPGPWLVQCRTANHLANGMTATINVAPNGLVAAAPAGAPVREYYIAAERDLWNFAPQGLVDNCTGAALEDEQTQYVDSKGAGLGSVYIKGLYREYTDASFSTRKLANPQHGILGPILHAHVGDTLVIVFTNKLPFDANLELGAGLAPLNGTGYGAVAPNATVMLAWTVPAGAGPGAADGAAVAYTYRSSIDPQGHENAGLIGALVVSSQGTAEPDLEVPLLFNIQDESLSVFLGDNVKAANHAVNTSSADFAESMKKHSVNGYMFCQQPPVVAMQGQDVRVILMGIGGKTDMHTPIFTDSVLLSPGNVAYTRTLLPGSVRVVELTTDKPGRFEFHCNVQDHYKAGMKGILEVQPKVGRLTQGELPIWRRRRRRALA